MIRGSRALVIRPNAELLKVPFGLPKLAWFNRLKTSHRNVREVDSVV
jgi:hypothetical protein